MAWLWKAPCKRDAASACALSRILAALCAELRTPREDSGPNNAPNGLAGDAAADAFAPHAPFAVDESEAEIGSREGFSDWDDNNKATRPAVSRFITNCQGTVY